MEHKVSVTILYDGVEEEEKRAAIERGEMPHALVCEEIEQALTERGHTVRKLAAGSSVMELAAQIEADDSEIIFNVCESFGGQNDQEQNVAALLELFGRRFTGAGSIGLALAQDKALAKKLLSFHDISTPNFFVMQDGEVDNPENLSFPMFVKPSNSDASIGIDEHSVVHNLKELLARISYIKTEFDAPALIEEYIEGREIYIGVLGGEKPTALPVLEWDFSNLPKGMERIASSEAKWDPNNAANQAPEVFPTDIPEEVVARVHAAAVDAFKSLKLRDYGRVDMRLRRKRASAPEDAPDAVTDGQADDWEFFLIEVNPNPHLASDGELATSAKQRSLEYGDLVERILETAMARPIHRRAE